MGALTLTPNVATWSIAALATLGVILRPFAWPEAIWATLGAVLLVVLGLMPWSVALEGVAIAEEEEAAGVEDGEENCCAGADPVVVNIAAPVAGGAGAGGVIAFGGDADAAEHGAVGDLHLVAPVDHVV